GMWLREFEHGLLLQPLGLELDGFDPVAKGFRSRTFNQSRRMLERAPDRAQRNDCRLAPGTDFGFECRDFGRRKRAAAGRLPEQSQEHIDVDVSLFRNGDARLCNATAPVELQREPPERRT